jgi:hypothetical protein
MEEKLDELLLADQLNVERSKGAVFKGFYEGPITFRYASVPTPHSSYVNLGHTIRLHLCN